MTQASPVAVRFSDLDIHPQVMDGIREAGYETATPIQAQSLPLTLRGGNVTGQAQTGTGKTAAFLIATFHRLLTQAPLPGRRLQDPRALIMAPTRELVKQISDNAEVLGKYTGLRLHTVYGGIGYEQQARAFASGVDVLCGTPGRLIDYYKKRLYDLGHLEILVVDECDRMFDMGFIEDVRWLVRKAPPMQKRQNLLFSATVDWRVQELAWEYMNNPVVVEVETHRRPPSAIRQVVYHVALAEKANLLVGLLKRDILSMPGARVLVFCNRRQHCTRVADILNANGIESLVLSGMLDQARRFKVLDAFKRDDMPVMVATDVASRGLHIANVTHVINWDTPDNPTDYIHRIGRTARAGNEGVAITLASEDTVENLPRIEEHIGRKIDLVWPDDDLLNTKISVPPRRPHHDRNGGGRSGARRRSTTRRRGKGPGARSSDSRSGEHRG